MPYHPFLQGYVALQYHFWTGFQAGCRVPDGSQILSFAFKCGMIRICGRHSAPSLLCSPVRWGGAEGDFDVGS